MSNKNKNGEMRTAVIDQADVETLPADAPITEQKPAEGPKTASSLEIKETLFEKEKMFVLHVGKRGDAICVYAQKYGTSPRKINIRSFYTNDDDQLAPTKKGVSFTVDQAEALLPVLQQVIAAEKANKS